jgi:hypothetical protein
MAIDTATAETTAKQGHRMFHQAARADDIPNLYTTTVRLIVSPLNLCE